MKAHPTAYLGLDKTIGHNGYCFGSDGGGGAGFFRLPPHIAAKSPP